MGLAKWSDCICRFYTWFNVMFSNGIGVVLLWVSIPRWRKGIIVLVKCKSLSELIIINLDRWIALSWMKIDIKFFKTLLCMYSLWNKVINKLDVSRSCIEFFYCVFYPRFFKNNWHNICKETTSMDFLGGLGFFIFWQYWVLSRGTLSFYRYCLHVLIF